VHFFRRERTLIAPTQQVRGPESAKREYRPGAIKFQAVLRPNFCPPEISTGCGVLFHSCMLQQDDMVNTLRLLPGTVCGCSALGVPCFLKIWLFASNLWR